MSSANWNTTAGSANWGTTSNWDAGDYPSGVGATATLSGYDGANPSGYSGPSDTSGQHTVVLDVAVTLGTLNITDPNNYNTQTYIVSLGGGSLTMNQDGAGSGRALIYSNYYLTNRNTTLPDLTLADDVELRSFTPAQAVQTADFNDGGVARTITKTGSGFFAIGSGNPVTNLTGGGTIDIQEGMLRFYKSSGGNYNITLTTNNAKALLFTNNGTLGNHPTGNDVAVAGNNSTIEIGPNTLGTGNIDVGNWTINAGNASSLQFDSSYTATTDAGKTLHVQSGATLDLINSATDGTGRLLVKGTLKGTGTITTADNGTGLTEVRIVSGGNLSPGDTGGASGVLKAGSGSATNTHIALDSGANFTVDLNGFTAGSGYDQLNLIGDISLGGATLVKTLSFDPAGSPALFFIIANDSTDAVSGTFAGLADGASFNMTGGGATVPFKISYFGDSGSNAITGGNDVVIYAVPEPASLGLIALGGACLLRRRVG